MKSLFLRLGWLIVLSFMAISIPAQTEPESAGLVIVSQDASAQQLIHPGQRLDYRLNAGKTIKGGKLESVQDSSMTIAGREVYFQDVVEVIMVKGHKRPRGARLTRNSAVGIVVFGLLALLSLALFGGRSTSDSRALMLIFALLAVVFCPILLIIGLVLLATSRHRYSLGTGWKLQPQTTDPQ